MQRDVFFTEKANDTFESIGLQIRARWGEKEQKEFRKRTYKVAETISQFPFIFQAMENTGNVRKAFIHRNCSMFYEIKPTSIEILFFWDNRQDPIFL